MKAGVQCYGCDELQEKLETVYGERIIGLPEKRSVRISEWIVTPFYLPHTTRDKDTGALIPCQNFGYLIKIGDETLLYATDFEYIPYTFKSLKINYFLLECNHQAGLTDRSEAKYEHSLRGHSELETVKEIIRVNKTPDMRNVILCHLSDGWSDPETVQKEVQSVAGKWVSVEVAHAGMSVEMSKYPF